MATVDEALHDVTQTDLKVSRRALFGNPVNGGPKFNYHVESVNGNVSDQAVPTLPSFAKISW